MKCFLLTHYFVARAVCLGSWSHLIFNALAVGRRFALKISLYMAPFILSCTQISRPGPFAEKQPQSMMFSSPCFDQLWCSLNATQHCPPNTTSCVSTKQFYFALTIWHFRSTLLEHPKEYWVCSFANFRQARVCTSLSRGTYLTLQDLSPWQQPLLC